MPLLNKRRRARCFCSTTVDAESEAVRALNHRLAPHDNNQVNIARSPVTHHISAFKFICGSIKRALQEKKGCGVAIRA
jgi:hypothetical protein